MNKQFSFSLVKLLILLLLQANTLLAVSQAESFPLQAENFEHIQFRKIKANTHTYHDQQLTIAVDNSASLLMKPFDSVKQVTKVSFEWRSDGVPQVKNSQHELSRMGDDAVFKLGLLLKADSESLNPFMKPWLKQVKKLLKFPSDNMIYLVADAKHAPGERWDNPYNRRVTMIATDNAAGSHVDNGGWQQSSYQFEQPVDVVAIWLMADGDNTRSSFNSYIKNIKLE